MAKRYVYTKILEEMKKHKDSQVEISQLIGVNDLTLRKRLAGISQWRISEIEILCMHYNKSYDELFKI